MARVTTKQSEMARKSWQERAEVWRDKIEVSKLLTRLAKHVEGQADMTATQIKAAQILLSKAMPDLSASDHTSRTETPDPSAMLARLREVMGEEAFSKIAKAITPVDHTQVH